MHAAPPRGGRPAPAPTRGTPTPPEPIHANITYATFGNQQLQLDIYLPAAGAQPYPVMIYIHGGGWFTGEKYPLQAGIDGVLEHGIAVVAVNYRLTANWHAYGGERAFPAQIHDVKGAVRWIRANAEPYGLDPTRIGAWGSSSGAHLASMLATTGDDPSLEGDTGGNLDQSSRALLAVDYAGPIDLLTQGEDFTGGGHQDTDFYGSPSSVLLDWDQPGQGIVDIRNNLKNPSYPYPQLVALVYAASPLRHVSSDDGAHFIMHGDIDPSVPPMQSQRLADALTAVGVPVEHVVVTGLVHEDPPQSIDDAAVAFVVAQMAIDPTPPAAPQDVHVVEAGESSITLAWNPADDSETAVASYRITRNGEIIATVPGSVLQFTDHMLAAGATFSYVVSARNHQFGETAADAIDASTMLDTTPPAVETILAEGDAGIVRVRFTEPVDEATSEDAANYLISPAMDILFAELADDARTVTLITSSMNPSAAYAITISAVADRSTPVNSVTQPITIPFNFSPRVRNGLVALYDFDEAQGSVVLDRSEIEPLIDLHVEDMNDVAWAADGLTVAGDTVLASRWRATKVLDRVMKSNEVTLEAWLTPAEVQVGFPRVLGLSFRSSVRDISIAQPEGHWEFLQRTTTSDLNGFPSLSTANETAPPAMTHFVCTRSASGVNRVYLDGALAASNTRAGDYSNWSSMLWLLLANERELGDGWLGTFHLVAIYDRALSGEEIGANFAAGPELAPMPEPQLPCLADVVLGDRLVDVKDLLAVLGAWGTCGDECPPTCSGDLNGDCQVNLFDLLDLLGAWGECPE